MIIPNIDRERLQVLKKLRNFKEIFRKDMAYNDIAIKNRFSTSLQKIHFWKNRRARGRIDPPEFLRLN